MISSQTIELVKNKLVEIYHPITIYIFGSGVWGNLAPDSDLDLLVIVEQSDEKTHKRSLLGSRALADLMIPNDLLVFTKKEFEDRVQDVTTLCYKIKKEGKVLYAES